MKRHLLLTLLAWVFFLVLILLVVRTYPDSSIKTIGDKIFSLEDDDGDHAVLKVHYIDVGQGDSILIQSGDSNMLIDAGERQ